MTRPPRYHSGKKRGKLAKGRTYKALAIQQGKHTLYSFSEKAADLWSFVSISRREEDKDEGYQRVLSTSRVRAVADYILSENIIPGSVIIALDAGKFNKGEGTLHIDAGRDVAWVIDGQHRLAGAHLANEEGVNIELNVIALVDFGEQEQIEQFVTINREGKNVPTSL
jgi:DGQHR domain-containing protein